MRQVVARFKDGAVLKGTSLAVDPARPTFRLRSPDGPGEDVAFADLKALFFVRSLGGNPAHEEDLEPDPGDPRQRGSTVVRVEFDDGEVVVGLTSRYPPTRQHFFLVPVDRLSNNIRVLVNRDAVGLMEAITLT